jgi:hypothetical protein
VPSLCLSLLAFGASTAAWNALLPPLWLVLLLALVTPSLVLALTPRPQPNELGARLPRRELALHVLASFLRGLALAIQASTLLALAPRRTTPLTLRRS